MSQTFSTSEDKKLIGGVFNSMSDVQDVVNVGGGVYKREGYIRGYIKGYNS